ncbi:MAG: hypothetical protein E7384_05260 [Ruminococcaceae bacterium]|nr:hypothetical protein [Oscillospiraceae bacterium]
MQNEIYVYVDVVFLENLIIDYVIIDICEKISGYLTTPLKKLSGAGVGALYAVVLCIVPDIGNIFVLSSLLKIVVSVVICGISFGFKNRRKIIVSNVLLFGVSFVLAGLFVALKINGANVSITDGGVFAVWGYSPLSYIIETVFAGYILVGFVLYFVRKNNVHSSEIAELVAEIGGKKFSMKALCDTGNELKDSLHNLPVIVCEAECLKDFFCEEFDAFKECFFYANEAKICAMMKFFETEGFSERISVVPYRTVNNPGGMVCGLVCDRVYIDGKVRDGLKTTVCFVQIKLSDTGRYNAIAPPEFFEREKNK